jgi:hypothetical protein
MRSQLKAVLCSASLRSLEQKAFTSLRSAAAF